MKHKQRKEPESDRVQEQQRQWWFLTCKITMMDVDVTTNFNCKTNSLQFFMRLWANKCNSLSAVKKRSWKLLLTRWHLILDLLFIHVYSDWKWFLIFFMCHGNVTSRFTGLKKSRKINKQQKSMCARIVVCLCDFICSMTLSGYSIDMWNIFEDVRHISNDDDDTMGEKSVEDLLVIGFDFWIKICFFSFPIALFVAVGLSWKHHKYFCY